MTYKVAGDWTEHVEQEYDHLPAAMEAALILAAQHPRGAYTVSGPGIAANIWHTSDEESE